MPLNDLYVIYVFNVNNAGTKKINDVVTHLDWIILAKVKPFSAQKLYLKYPSLEHRRESWQYEGYQ